VAPRKANGEPTPTAFADTEARWCVSFARRSQLSDYAPEIDSCEQGNPAEDYRAPHPDTAETVGRKNIFMDVDHIPAGSISSRIQTAKSPHAKLLWSGTRVAGHGSTPSVEIEQHWVPWAETRSDREAEQTEQQRLAILNAAEEHQTRAAARW